MKFLQYYKEELEKAPELTQEQSSKILKFIFKNSPYSKSFTIDFLVFLEDYELNLNNYQEEFKTEKILKNLLCILADIAYIYENGTRDGGVASFAYNERAEAILASSMAQTELECLNNKHDEEHDLIAKLGEAALYGENIERLKADILAENFANEIMESEANELLNA